MSTRIPPVLRQHHVADRVELVDGSFFDSVPTGGDVYVLKMILHDWPDEKAVEILQTVRSAAKVGTKVLVMDCVYPDHEREFLGNGKDLEMLLQQAGRERTVPEYRSLLERAGFRMTRRVPTASPLSFVEAEAV